MALEKALPRRSVEMLEDFAMDFMKYSLCYATHSRRKTLIKSRGVRREVTQ